MRSRPGTSTAARTVSPAATTRRRADRAPPAAGTGGRGGARPALLGGVLTPIIGGVEEREGGVALLLHVGVSGPRLGERVPRGGEVRGHAAVEIELRLDAHPAPDRGDEERHHGRRRTARS